jgi:sarcosine dehydrogenase
VARLAEDRFYIVTGTGFRTHDFGWIADHLPGDVRIEDVTEGWGTLSLMGPRARDGAGRGDRRRCVERGLPLRPCARDRVGRGDLVRALRVTYVGELGWELHVPLARSAASSTR